MPKSELVSKLKEQEKAIRQQLYGMEIVIKIFCLAKAADLTILLIGEHGIAKSSLARLWTQTMTIKEENEIRPMTFRVITSSEVDDALIAHPDIAVFRKENKLVMKRGELMIKDHIFVDEFYLWNNKYRAKLHQLLEEGTYAGLDVLTKTYTFATNPLTEWFAGQIEDRNLATEDRIDIFVPMFQPDITSSHKLMRKFGKYGKKTPKLEPSATWEDYLKMREEIHLINLPADKLVWLSLLGEECSACKYTKSKFDLGQASMSIKCKECNRNQCICARVGLSKPRFLRATVILAKALAWYDGRDEVVWEDIYSAIEYSMPHRLIFLQKQVGILDCKKEIEEILRIFNEDMEQWRNREVFLKLEEIAQSARETPPKFLEDESQALLIEIQEDLPILNYANEVIDYAKNRARKYFTKVAESGKITPEKIDEFRDLMDDSGLDEYAKSDILGILGIEYVPKGRPKKSKSPEAEKSNEDEEAEEA